MQSEKYSLAQKYESPKRQKKKQAEREKAEVLKNIGRISASFKNAKINHVEDMDFEETKCVKRKCSKT
jgi:hypothetical protein